MGRYKLLLKSEYLNPFDTALDHQGKLYNLSSGSPWKDESAEPILKIPEVGYTLAAEFTEYRLFTISIEVNRNIINSLLSSTNKS